MSSQYFFPHDKWESAVDFLCAVKPWWGRYARRFTVVPFYVEPDGDKKWGGYIFSTPEWELYADVGFVESAPLEYVAGLIERELQRSVRDIRGRLAYVDRDFYRQYGNISAEMEICDVLREEHVGLGEAFARDSRRALFPVERQRKWGVQDTPCVPEETEWLPDMVGLPSGSSLESCYNRFVELEMARQSGQDSDSGEADSDGSSDDDAIEGAGDEQSEDFSDDDFLQDSGGSSSQDGEEPEENNVEEANQDCSSGGGTAMDDLEDDEDSDGEDSDTNGSPSGSNGLGSPEGSLEDTPDSEGASGSKGEQEDENSPAKSSAGGQQSGSSGSQEGAEQTDEEGEVGCEPEEDDENAQGGSDGESEGASAVDGEPAEDSDVAGSEDDGSANPGEVLDAIDELRKDEGRDWYAKDYEPLSRDTPETVGSSVRDIDALQEFAEDVMAYSRGGSIPGSAPGELSIEVSRDVLRSVNLSWDKILERMVANKVGDSKINGMQDVSYEVRNPHQPRTGVLMPGMYDSPVVISLIIDTSGSMTQHLPTTLGVVEDVLTSASEGSERGIQWVSVDVGVADSGMAYTLDDSILEGSSKGFGGTDLGWVVRDVAQGTFTHKGLLFDKPDVLIVVTDCAWSFPEVDNPAFGRDAGVVVVSVQPWEEAWRYSEAPAWVQEGINWVYADDSA